MVSAPLGSPIKLPSQKIFNPITEAFIDFYHSLENNCRLTLYLDIELACSAEKTAHMFTLFFSHQ